MVFNYGDWKEISGDDESLLFQRKVLKEGVNKKNLNEVAGVNLLETKTLSCWDGKKTKPRKFMMRKRWSMEINSQKK